MLTTAGIVCLRVGASEETPLACSITGSGTLAFTLPPATARPNAVAKNIALISMTFVLSGRKRTEAGLDVVTTSADFADQ
jgi:hypothetical protein